MNQKFKNLSFDNNFNSLHVFQALLGLCSLRSGRTGTSRRGLPCPVSGPCPRIHEQKRPITLPPVWRPDNRDMDE